MNIVELRSQHDADDVVKALRNIADDIEAGEYDFAPNMAVLVLARETVSRERDGLRVGFGWRTHGLGEKCTVFTARGILQSAACSSEGDQ